MDHISAGASRTSIKSQFHVLSPIKDKPPGKQGSARQEPTCDLTAQQTRTLHVNNRDGNSKHEPAKSQGKGFYNLLG